MDLPVEPIVLVVLPTLIFENELDPSRLRELDVLSYSLVDKKTWWNVTQP